MSDNAPIACTLGVAARSERLRLIDRLLQDGVVSSERGPLRLRLDFKPDVRDRVEAWVALERACCGFLDFDLTPCGDVLRLTITGQEESRSAAETIFEGLIRQAPAAGCTCC